MIYCTASWGAFNFILGSSGFTFWFALLHCIFPHSFINTDAYGMPFYGGLIGCKWTDAKKKKVLEVVNGEKPARFLGGNPSLVITLWKHQMKFFACWVKLRPQKMYGIYLQSQTVFHPSRAVLGLPRCLTEALPVPMQSFSFELTVSDYKQVKKKIYQSIQTKEHNSSGVITDSRWSVKMHSSLGHTFKPKC